MSALQLLGGARWDGAGCADCFCGWGGRGGAAPNPFAYLSVDAVTNNLASVSSRSFQ